MQRIYIICLIFPCLCILCWHDIKYRKLPNALTLGLALLGLACRLYLDGLAGLCDGLLGGLVCGAFLFLPFMFKAAGGGDVKMLFATGIISGLKYSFAELLFVSAAGVLLGIIMLAFRMVQPTRMRHYARMLLDWRYDRKKAEESLPPKTSEKGRIPFGIAIAVGTMAALIFAYFMETHP